MYATPPLDVFVTIQKRSMDLPFGRMDSETNHDVGKLWQTAVDCAAPPHHRWDGLTRTGRRNSPIATPLAAAGAERQSRESQRTTRGERNRYVRPITSNHKAEGGVPAFKTLSRPDGSRTAASTSAKRSTPASRSISNSSVVLTVSRFNAS